MDSMWHVVDAVNNYSKFAITYPSSVEGQEKNVAGFKKASSVDFDVCAGVIDGILKWMQKAYSSRGDKGRHGSEKIFC